MTGINGPGPAVFPQIDARHPHPFLCIVVVGVDVHGRFAGTATDFRGGLRVVPKFGLRFGAFTGNVVVVVWMCRSWWRWW